MIKEKQLQVFRAKSGNSYILTDEIGEMSYIFFPHLNKIGFKGQIPTKNRINDEFLGMVKIIDNSPELLSLVKLTGGS
jgi:hypothetical protein